MQHRYERNIDPRIGKVNVCLFCSEPFRHPNHIGAPIDVSQVLKGDIVRFKSYALRVESEPTQEGNFIVLRGRISIDGCPFVTKKFLAPLDVVIERTQ